MQCFILSEFPTLQNQDFEVFHNSMKNQIEKNGFIENQDFASFDNIIKRENGATIKVNLMKILIFRRLRFSLNMKTE